MKLFQDRYDAGRQLATMLFDYSKEDNLVVLGLPRGGIPVAFEVAKALRKPLDVFVVRKLGLPGFEELAIGAIASGNVHVLNENVLSNIPNASHVLKAVINQESKELHRREQLYHTNQSAIDIANKIIILVDDGLATGATMRAAVSALRKQNVTKIIVAVPVGAPESCQILRTLADEVICLHEPKTFHAVGSFYGDFLQTPDSEVCKLLKLASEIS